MTLVANVKGYINGQEWGMLEPPVTLLTYEQIIALDLNPALTELNSNPTEYYNYLNSSGHIVPDDGWGLHNAIGDTTRSGSQTWSFTGKRYSHSGKEGGQIYRDNGTFTNFVY